MIVAISIPKPVGIPQHLPSGTGRFVGRSEDLESLHHSLQNHERVAITTITGMGGIGKTELALQYAWTYWKTSYQRIKLTIILWLKQGAISILVSRNGYGSTIINN